MTDPTNALVLPVSQTRSRMGRGERMLLADAMILPLYELAGTVPRLRLVEGLLSPALSSKGTSKGGEGEAVRV